MHLVVSDRPKEVCALNSRVVTAEQRLFLLYFQGKNLCGKNIRSLDHGSAVRHSKGLKSNENKEREGTNANSPGQNVNREEKNRTVM